MLEDSVVTIVSERGLLIILVRLVIYIFNVTTYRKKLVIREEKKQRTSYKITHNATNIKMQIYAIIS